MVHEYKLSVFEGPLDLLLFLVSKHKLNIADIEIISLVEQYLDFIGDLSDDMEYAGEFIDMAAQLIYIKTVYLLPKKEEAEILKKELEGRLIEYSIAKLASAELRKMWLAQPFTTKQPVKLKISTEYKLTHSPEELVKAWEALGKAPKKPSLTSSVFSTFVSKRFVSVTTRMVFVLKELYSEGECVIDRIFDSIADRSERVATFLAILELTRNGRILLDETNTRMTLNRSYTPDEGDEGGENSQFDDIAPEGDDRDDQDILNGQ